MKSQTVTFHSNIIKQVNNSMRYLLILIINLIIISCKNEKDTNKEIHSTIENINPIVELSSDSNRRKTYKSECENHLIKIKKNDTFSNIASRYYGNWRFFKLIQRYTGESTPKINTILEIPKIKCFLNTSAQKELSHIGKEAEAAIKAYKKLKFYLFSYYKSGRYNPNEVLRIKKIKENIKRYLDNYKIKIIEELNEDINTKPITLQVKHAKNILNQLRPYKRSKGSNYTKRSKKTELFYFYLSNTIEYSMVALRKQAKT